MKAGLELQTSHSYKYTVPSPINPIFQKSSCIPKHLAPLRIKDTCACMPPILVDSIASPHIETFLNRQVTSSQVNNKHHPNSRMISLQWVSTPFSLPLISHARSMILNV